MGDKFDILVVGTGGLAIQCLPLLKEKYKNIAFYNDVNSELRNFWDVAYPVFHNVEINRVIYDYIIAISNPKSRHSIREKFGHPAKNLIDSKYENERLFNRLNKEGIIILQDCILEHGIDIGDSTIINTRCSIHHGSVIEQFVTLSPNVVILGNCHIRQFTFIGAGTIVRENTTIGSNCVIGMGSVVVEDIPDNSVAYGNPCRVIRKNK